MLGLVVFAVSMFPSHILGTTGLARRLAARGFRIEYWAPRCARRLIEKQGFAHRDLDSVLHCYDAVLPFGWTGIARYPRRHLFVVRELRRRLKILPAALASFERSLDRSLACQSPLLMLFDPFLVQYVPLLRERGVRCIAINDKPLPAWDPWVPPPNSGAVARNSRAGRLYVRFLWMHRRLRDLAHRSLHPARALGAYTTEHLIDAIQQRVGHAARGVRSRRWIDYDLHFSDVDEWVLGSGASDFPRALPLPANVLYIGPCVDGARVEEACPVKRERDTRYFVYVSMGTAMWRWDHDLPLLRRILAALRGIPGMQVVVATGNARAADTLDVEEDNVRVFASVPQLSVLREADLAITHAGANTFRECVFTSTPMLAFPRAFDQHGNAARILYHGLGLRGDRRIATTASIRRMALAILEDGAYKARVAQLANALDAEETTLLDIALRRALLRAWGETPSCERDRGPARDGA